MVSVVGPERVVCLGAAVQVRRGERSSIRAKCQRMEICMRSVCFTRAQSLFLLVLRSVLLSPSLSLPVSLCFLLVPLSLVLLAGCQPSSSNTFQLCSSAMAHAREPEDIQPFSFQSLNPHSMLPTICFLSFTILWQLDNPLKKYKTKSLWMIHSVSATATVLFSSLCNITLSSTIFYLSVFLSVSSLNFHRSITINIQYWHLSTCNVSVGSSKCLETTMKIWDSKSNANLKIHR